MFSDDRPMTDNEFMKLMEPENPPNIITCPRCRGKGFFFKGDRIDKNTGEHPILACPVCKGTGIIDEPTT
jgi:predicted Zn-ribbon and HTH transcriptional regulator